MSQAFNIRAGQRAFERGVDQHRVTELLARRPYGKTTIASRIALKKMMRQAGHTVVFGSVKLDLGREIVRQEAEVMQKAFAAVAASAQHGETLLKLADGQTGKELDGDIRQPGSTARTASGTPVNHHPTTVCTPVNDHPE